MTVTWDDLSAVVDLAARDGVHIPGTDYNWWHTWKPRTPEAAGATITGRCRQAGTPPAAARNQHSRPRPTGLPARTGRWPPGTGTPGTRR